MAAACETRDVIAFDSPNLLLKFYPISKSANRAAEEVIGRLIPKFGKENGQTRFGTAPRARVRLGLR